MVVLIVVDLASPPTSNGDLPRKAASITDVVNGEHFFSACGARSRTATATDIRRQLPQSSYLTQIFSPCGVPRVDLASSAPTSDGSFTFDLSKKSRIRQTTR